MKFHLITGPMGTGAKPAVEKLFVSACDKLGIEFVSYNIKTLDPSTLTELGADDMLYRSKVGSRARLIERLLISNDCSHFYKNLSTAFHSRGGSYHVNKKAGLPVIPTVPFLPGTEEGILKAVEELGQFPIIIKVVGGAHGVGVMRVDSLQSLKSVLDYLRSTDVEVLLRKYIKNHYQVRVVVVGDSVVSSRATYAVEGEFRTNSVKDYRNQKHEPVELSVEIQNICVEAVHSHGSETGGVDLLFDEEGNEYIAEVNFPNDFSYNQEITGVDIASEMVKFLMDKSYTPPKFTLSK